MSLVYLKNKKNGVTYVYESTGYWNKEKQQARNTRKCIGKLDPVTGNLIPSKKDAAIIISAPTQPGPIPSVECKRSFYGATYLFGEESRLPVYFRKLPGNIADVKTIQKLLTDIDFLQLDKVKLVMDRGFYSEDNINALYQKHYKFLIAGRTSLKFVQKKLDEVRDTMISRPHYSSKYRLNYHSSMIDWNYSAIKKRSQTVETGERRMYLHLYYNDQRATDDKIEFNELLDRLEEELLSGKRNPEHERLYSKYFEINETPVRGMSLIPKQESINKAQKNYGCFSLLSNDVKNPLEALEIYRSKDLIEKAFGNLKERLNMRRTSVSSDESLDGKLFVQFIALIYLSYIKKVMSDNNLFKTYTMQELLDEFDVIERFEQPGRKHHIGEMTKKQMELYGLLRVDVPS